MNEGCSCSGCFLLGIFMVIALVFGWFLSISAGIVLGGVFIIYIIINLISKVFKK